MHLYLYVMDIHCRGPMAILLIQSLFTTLTLLRYWCVCVLSRQFDIFFECGRVVLMAMCWPPRGYRGL